MKFNCFSVAKDPQTNQSPFPPGWLPYQANRFSSTNKGVAIETREMTYLFNSRTAESFLASALCGGAIGKPNFGFPLARIRDIEPSV